MRTAAALLLALLVTPVRAAEAVALERLALVAGASSGGPGRTTLRYATSDAREVARVLAQLGGVDGGDLVVVEEPNAAALRAAIAGLGRRAAEIRSAGRRPELFVYYSGHSDEEGLLLGTSRLSYVQLRRDLDEVPAEVRVAILDSCASGAFTRRKGGQMRPAFQVDEANRVRGHAFLTSSAADEASQESDRLRASFFTHALLTGLRGAADTTGDGVVTLNEAYQFAFRETLARTEATQSGPQHPTYDISLVGSGDVVITDLRRAGAVLVLPEPLVGQVFVRSSAGQLVAELRKLPGVRIDLAVDPGDYQIRVAREGRVREARLSLAPAERSALAESRLDPVSLEATAARGPESDSGDPVAATAPSPPEEPQPGRLAGRNVVSVTMGAAALRGDHQTVGGTVVESSGTTGLTVEVAYTRWVSDRFAIEAAWIGRGIQGEARQAGDTTTAEGSLAMGLVLGARYSHPVATSHGLFLTASAAAGPYAGINGQSVSTSSGASQDSGTVEWVPGGRLRAGIDFFATRHILLSLAGGYSLIGRFRNVVGSSRDHSGFDAGVALGFGWGR